MTEHPPSDDALREAVARQRRLWARQAPRYDREMRFFERVLFGDARAWACSQAAGQVLEVAVGTGRNLPFYPHDIQLTGVDLSPEMLAIAGARAGELGRVIELTEADAHALPFPDGSFDTVVCTFSLCNIPDERRAIAEMHRVLRPGGLLILADHVASTSLPLRTVQAARRETHLPPLRRPPDPPTAPACGRRRLQHRARRALQERHRGAAHRAQARGAGGVRPGQRSGLLTTAVSTTSFAD